MSTIESSSEQLRSHAKFGLRGYDPVHCASAEQAADDDLVAATGDRALLAAWSKLGVSTFDTNAS